MTYEIWLICLFICQILNIHVRTRISENILLKNPCLRPYFPEQKKAVEEKLLSTTGYRSMEMNYETDESLIGGMVIRIGDRVVDSSIKTKLEVLKKSLLSVQISYTH